MKPFTRQFFFFPAKNILLEKEDDRMKNKAVY